MSSAARKLLDEALALSEEERLELATDLIEAIAHAKRRSGYWLGRR